MDTDVEILAGVLDTIRSMYEDPHEQRIALERQMDIPDVRAAIARYLLKYNAMAVRVPLVGKVA